MSTRPRLFSVWFGSGMYATMAAVLAGSARDHLPDWDVDVRQIDPRRFPMYLGAGHGIQTNAQKFAHWADAVERSNDGDRLLLIDSDCAILRPLSDVWDLDFDVAYTRRAGGKFPMNGGVVFVRSSPRTRAFFVRWWDENLRLLRDREAHRPWRSKYAGINQAAFGALLETGRAKDVELLALPCSEWNCEDSAWHAFDADRTRILHVKSALRWALFPDEQEKRAGYETLRPVLGPLASRWRAIASQHNAEAA